MPKDREWEQGLATDVRVLFKRSSAHPIEYAITLLVLRNGVWHTVRLFDNAHDPDEHHEHCYIGSEKQEPIVTFGPVNRAMYAARAKLRDGWRDILTSWEKTR